MTFLFGILIFKHLSICINSVTKAPVFSTSTHPYIAHNYRDSGGGPVHARVPIHAHP